VHTYTQSSPPQKHIPGSFVNSKIVSEDTFDGSLVEAFPGIDLPTKPMDMRMTPDGTKWWIAGQLGEIVEVGQKRRWVRRYMLASGGFNITYLRVGKELSVATIYCKYSFCFSEPFQVNDANRYRVGPGIMRLEYCRWPV